MSDLPSLSDFLIRELEYLRDKQWKIFSWASTIFTALIGGVIVLKTRDHPHHLNLGIRCTLTMGSAGALCFRRRLGRL